ncbi:MAG: hypothetical protein JNJ83_08895 [Verrucomicrobiaceae bacterium]|nr:hypothetical protein [Verrucomicrobiaceae bacterium]
MIFRPRDTIFLERETDGLMSRAGVAKSFAKKLVESAQKSARNPALRNRNAKALHGVAVEQVGFLKNPATLAAGRMVWTTPKGVLAATHAGGHGDPPDGERAGDLSSVLRV